MANPTIWQVTLPSGSVYDIEDKVARAAATKGIEMVRCTNAANTPKDVQWDDDGTTITGTLEASASTESKIYLVPIEHPGEDNIFAEYITYVSQETPVKLYAWECIGTTAIDLSTLGDLAFKDSASGAFTPSGSIAVNEANGSGTSYTPGGTVYVNESTGSGTSYTPEGSVAAPTISKVTAGSTDSIVPFGSAGTLPTLTMTVSDGNLAISFSQGTLPSGGTPVTVKTGDATYEASAPAFTGVEKKLAFEGTEKKFAFTGNSGTVTVQ